ncbi:MAG: GNAT family N-acetyltransferase [Candidatus Algichlamydia australiensis]|nr:GNAT family N-acetyltransferase [Chlamydiales bacterium]
MQKNWNLEITTHPNAEDVNFLTKKINEEVVNKGNAYPFAMYLRKSEEIIAGCNGSIIFGSIYTDQLWVAPAHRRKGLGKKLMEAIHKYGKKNSCRIATVTTMSFQAIEFYKKLGYKIDFVREGYVDNSSCIFLSLKI